MAIVIVAVIVIAAIAVVAIYYTGTGTISVSTPGTVFAAGDTVKFTANVAPPALVSAGPVDWNFGDGSTVTAGPASQSHQYQYPGDYFVLVGSTLGNGKRIDNSQRLFEIQAVQPNVILSNLGSDSAYAVLAINKTASSAGAPNLPTGGKLVYTADIQQEPTFFFASEVNPANNTWTNYSWGVTTMTISYGDGSAAVTNSTTDPFGNPLAAYTGSHTFATAGIYTMTVALTTQNYSATQYNGAPATPAEVPLAGSSNTITTHVAQTITVGSYTLPPITIQNPGVIINMEAETGGYFSLDPSLDYESVGFEVIANVYETLLAYNGTQTSSFVPVVADSIPTVQNGGISPDYMNYTFHIRQGLHFTYSSTGNGLLDNVTAWDVKYSITRTMIFDSGSPFTPGWIVSQFLVPGTFVPTPIDAATYQAIYNSITVDNATQKLTFHLQLPAPPTLFYQVVSDTLGTGIIDHKWLEATGPKLVWSPAGFSDYEQFSYAPSYVPAWRNGAAGSGPFQIQYENNPNDVVLVPSPSFTPLYGVKAADPSVQKVILEYVGSDSVRELALQSGAADIAGISSAHFNVVNSLVSQNLIHTQFIQTLNLFWWNFNMDIYSPGGTNLYGNMVPSDFFVDINMRKAFFWAFNFQQYLNTFVGNGLWGVNFGTTYNGMIPSGMIGYQNLSAYNVFDMTKAKQAFQNTTWYKTGHHGFTITINPPTADPVDENAAAAWAQNIQQLDTGITVNVQAISFTDAIGNSVAWQDPMAIYFLGWLPDYPFPTDYTVPMLLPSTGAVGNTSAANGGTYPNANNLNIPYFQSDANGTGQVPQLQKMHDLIIDTITTNATNVPVVVNESEQADILAANLYLYVPATQQNTFFSFRTWIYGMNLETNPVLGGADLLYDLLSKGTGTTTTASLGASSLSAGSSPALVLALAAPMSILSLIGAAEVRDRRTRKERRNR